MKYKKHILVVDDEEDLLDLLEYNLSVEGFEVTCVSTGEEAIKFALQNIPDLIILDIMLPAMDGLDVIKHLKNSSILKNIPVIFLSAKSEETDIVLGLEFGADDYVIKPFSLKVLVSRIKAVLRCMAEGEINNSDAIRVGKLLIFPMGRRVFFDGKPIGVTNVEFNILELMARKPGWVFSTSEIISSIHGKRHKVTDNSINVHIYGLRKKLGPGKKYLQTVRGAGYRIVG